MNDTLRCKHEKRKIDALRKWCDGLFPVYSAAREHMMDMESDLFGTVNFSVHMIAYVNTDEGSKNSEYLDDRRQSKHVGQHRGRQSVFWRASH